MNKEYDESCDLYSFGIVLWEMMTRQEPYSEINSFEDLVQLVRPADGADGHDDDGDCFFPGLPSAFQAQAAHGLS